jgi:hypothetical protein
MNAADNVTGNNRMVLLLIAGIPLTMILAATWLWYFVVQGDLDLVGAMGTANRGALVTPPRQIDDGTLLGENGHPLPYSDLEPRWTFAVPLEGGVCDARCERNLYLTRQIHVAMGKEFNRIRRIFLSEAPLSDIRLDVETLSDERPSPPDFATLLEKEHRGTKFMQLPAGGHRALFVEQAQARDTWYLVDPAGWVMMSYNDEVPYKDVISDLKFLLKNSGT